MFGARPKQGGFTLVELVLALVLSGAFLMLITPAIRFAIKQPEQARFLAEASHKALLVSELVQRELELAQSVVVGTDSRCLDMSLNTELHRYCFDQQGLILQAQGESSRLLVAGVEGRFLLRSSGFMPSKVLDLQVAASNDPALSFSRLLVLPGVGELQNVSR